MLVEINGRTIAMSKSINKQFCIEVDGYLSKRQKNALLFAVASLCKGFDEKRLESEATGSAKDEQ